MKREDVLKGSGFVNIGNLGEGGDRNNTFDRLNSILMADIDSLSDLEYFLQQVVRASADIVSARSSKLVLYKEGEGKEGLPASNPDGISTTDDSINIPLVLRGLEHPIGYIEVNGRKDGNSFDIRDLVSLLMMGRQATLKIENDLFYRRIYENMIEALRSMVNIMESRDPYIRCHSSRVTHYALNIAKTLDLPVHERDIIRLASLLHDIGKVGIPDIILSKKGGLTQQEKAIIETHSLIGENIVRPLAFLFREGEIIRCHHECYDGSGYPDGLKGEEIPVSARVIAVADSYDAMTSDRPYRKAKSAKESIEEINRLQSVKYDPVIVNAFKRCLERRLEPAPACV